MDDGEEQYEDDAPAITLGDYLRPGEQVTLTVREPPEAFTSQYAEDENEKDAFRLPAFFMESDYAFQNGDGDELADGDECVLVSWSTRLNRALGELAGGIADDGEDPGEALTGETAKIQKEGSGMNVQYDVTHVEGE